MVYVLFFGAVAVAGVTGYLIRASIEAVKQHDEQRDEPVNHTGYCAYGSYDTT